VHVHGAVPGDRVVRRGTGERMSALQFAVAMDSGAIFGPFTSRTEADRFAAFVAEEVGPARVCPLCSPVLELLNFRDAMRELHK
jgi:hypothetical protein